MGKVDDNKKHKLRALLDTAFELFTENGLANTSISDITKSSGVAKGTFYLYFKDKYDIRNKLIAYESCKVLRKAYDASLETIQNCTNLEDKVVALIDNVLLQFEEKPKLLMLISKQLSWGILKKEVSRPILDEDFDFAQLFHKLSEQYGIPLADSEIMLFLIVELVGSACYSSILYQEPCPIAELKPSLYESVRLIVQQFSDKKEG